MSLQKLAPMPKDLKGTQALSLPSIKLGKKLKKKHGFHDWYSWCVANWGTKWDIDATLDEDCEITDTMLSYSFDSAWSPPIEAIRKGSEKFRNLLFILKYEEFGAGFIGTAKIQKGQVEDAGINL